MTIPQIPPNPLGQNAAVNGTAPPDWLSTTLVSVFRGSTNTTPVEHVSLATMLARMQDGTYEEPTEQLRGLLANGDTDGYKQAKEQSVAFTPCCDLQTRAGKTPWPDKLLSTTGIVHFDCDDLDDPDTLKQQLAHDPHLAFAFVSPSGRGLKIGIAARGIIDAASYKHAWGVLLAHLKSAYPDVHLNEDVHVKYLNALCYVSHDPALYQDLDACPFDTPPAADPPPGDDPPPPTQAPDYPRVARALADIPNADVHYDTWLQVGMALHSTQAAWATGLWDSWSRQSAKYDAREQAATWQRLRADGKVTIATLFHLAKEARNGTRATPDITQAAPATDRASDPAASLGTVSPCTQGANAQRIHRAFEGTLHYTTGTGWVFWTGKYWRMDPTRDDALTTGVVSTLPTLIANEAQALTQIALSVPRGREQKDLLALASDRLQWAIRSDNASALSGALKMAKSGMLILNDQFDAHPWLFNCRNGTIDLTTGTMGPHDPAHLLTRCAPVAFDKQATCPRWCRFVQEVFDNDMTMVAFLQRAIGWSLTGVVQERALFFLYGPSGYNGKTTVVETVKELLGSCGEEEVGYARKVDVSTFMHSKNIEENQRKMASLVGPRFVYTSEVDESHRLNEQLIKDITGNDTLDARRLYHETFSFKPTFKPWMYGNYKPDIRGTDEAIWGRVKLIPFEVSFKDRMDLTLADTLKSELPGILNWAIAGCLAWQKDGLQPPAKVEEATTAYRTEQDVFAPFIADMCDVLPEATIKTSRLWAAYKRWCARNDQEEQSQTRLGNYLTAKGYRSDGNKSGHGALRAGLDLKKEPEPPDAWDVPDREPAPPDATPCEQQVASVSASNDAAKSTLQDELLPVATPFSGKSPEPPLLRYFLEKGVATGSNEGNKNPLTRPNACDAPATPSPATGSNGQADAAAMEAPPQFCPGCGIGNTLEERTTWLIRPGYWECYKKACGYRLAKAVQP